MLILKIFRIFFAIFLLLLFSVKSFAASIKEIIITGNERITNETILTFLPVKLNDDIQLDQVNLITKELYNTNFFENISVKFDNNILTINVIENPIIQSVIYNGIKSDTLKEFVTSGSLLKNRSSFIKLYLEKDIAKILENLKIRGYYFSTIETKISKLDGNKINLIYDINLGKKAKIRKISFIGNKVFKNKKLKGVILSEEYKFWKFLSSKKFINESLVNFDKRLLKNFFLNSGYYNVIISSTFAKITDDNEFELIYNIDAGNKINFGRLSLDLPINYDEDNFLNLSKTLKKLEKQTYSINAIDDIIEEIDLLALYEEYETIDVEVQENQVGDELNIKFLIKETEKVSIKKINILGNNVTRENVIRNQFEIDEGDFYNKILFNKTINNIKSLNFFKTVNSEILDEKKTNDKIINITVEEKPTGELGASAGVGTNGNSIGFFVRENNYLGKGLSLETNITLSDDSIRGLLSVNNPNFNDTDKSVYSKIESSEIDKLKSSGYKTSRTGFSYVTQFEILNDLDFGLGNRNYYQNIETDSTASNLQKKQQGDYFDSFINFDFIYDKRNQKYKTTDGFISNYSIEIPAISDTDTLSNTYSYKYFTELYNQNVTSVSFYAKMSNSLSNKDIKLTERNFIPASRLRGFSAGGIGPKDGNDFVGGNYASSVNIMSTLPQLFQENQNIDFLTFLDIGNVWGVDYDSSISDSNVIRSSIGVGVDWFTPVGPLNFSLSQPLTKANTDSTETFRFNLGTNF